MANKLEPAPQGAGPSPNAPAGAAAGRARSSGGMATRLHQVLHDHPTLGPAFVLLIAVIAFSVTADRFLAPANLSLIVQQVMVVGTLGIAQTLSLIHI